MTDLHQDALKTILDRATEEVNKNNGGKLPVRSYSEPPRAATQYRDGDVGRECADRLIDAAEKTALAIEAQADERLAVAMSQVEDAKAHVETSKKIANDVRQGGEAQAQQAIDLANRLHESAELMATIGNKFEAVQ